MVRKGDSYLESPFWVCKNVYIEIKDKIYDPQMITRLSSNDIVNRLKRIICGFNGYHITNIKKKGEF